MNILMTGATGFIGKNLLRVFETNHYYNKSEIVLLTSREIAGYKCIIHKDYKFCKEDFYKLKAQGIDALILLGAFIPKVSSEANDIQRSISNIVNTEYLLENIPTIPKKIIYLSTIDVYGPNINILMEDNIPDPISLYGQSKLFIEKVLEIWSKNNNSILQILRIGHIYGEGEDAYKKILPISIKTILENRSPVIYTSGKEKRSFLYIDDCCEMIANSLCLKKYVGPINIVSNKSVSVLELVNLIISISGKNISPNIENRNIDTKDFIFNNDKMVKYLGKEKISLREGITKEYEYFENKLY